MDFWSRVKDAVDKGLVASKDALGKAGEAARDLGEKGVLKIEIRELENRIKDLLRSLGFYVYEQFEKEGKASVTSKNTELTKILDLIRQAEKDIQTREVRIASLKKQEEQEQA